MIDTIEDIPPLPTLVTSPSLDQPSTDQPPTDEPPNDQPPEEPSNISESGK